MLTRTAVHPLNCPHCTTLKGWLDDARLCPRHHTPADPQQAQLPTIAGRLRLHHRQFLSCVHTAPHSPPSLLLPFKRCCGLGRLR